MKRMVPRYHRTPSCKRPAALWIGQGKHDDALAFLAPIHTWSAPAPTKYVLKINLDHQGAQSRHTVDAAGPRRTFILEACPRAFRACGIFRPFGKQVAGLGFSISAAATLPLRCASRPASSSNLSDQCPCYQWQAARRGCKELRLFS